MAEDDWETECFLDPAGTRYCFKTRNAFVQVPRQILDSMIQARELVPTSAPGEESESAFGPHELRDPAFIQRHTHSWRKTSSTHNGYSVFQCRICEDAVIEGATP